MPLFLRTNGAIIQPIESTECAADVTQQKTITDSKENESKHVCVRFMRLIGAVVRLFERTEH